MSSKRQVITISGNSMSPYLKVGDQLEFEITKDASLGNIVLLKDSSELVVHRLLPYNFTKGDHNKNYDLPHSSEKRIVGVATARIEGQKRIRVGSSILNRLISFLSSLNTQNSNSHKFSRGAIFILGSLARWLKV